jgi:2-desacetyl-2-hydroxyethyl bacteriochlorophyllide A dehydrogenase
MEAFVITEPRHGEVRNVPVPEPGSGQVLVDVAYCGICGTDYNIYKGTFLSHYPLIPGHEFSGTIAAVGPDVDGWQEGDRVAVDPSLFCGTCYYCRNRQWNHCANWGAIGDTRDGALAQFVAVPAANLYRLPDSLTLEEGAFTEPLACVMWGMQRVRVLPGDRALVFGAGPIGILIVQALNLSGTSEVVCVDVASEKLALAQELGATSTYVNGPDLGGQLTEHTKGLGFDIVVDVTGVPAVIQEMFRYAAKRAKILQFGVAPTDARVEISPFDIYHNDWEIYGSMAVNYTMQPSLELLASGRIKVKPLITRIALLDEMDGILSRPKTGNEEKTLIRP